MNTGIQIIEQFSIWTVCLEDKPIGHEQGGRRPFFVISTLEYNTHSKTPIGFIMSASEKKSRNKFVIKIEGMSNVDSHVNVSQIRTLDIYRFEKHLYDAQREVGLSIISKFINSLTCKNSDEVQEQINSLRKII